MALGWLAFIVFLGKVDLIEEQAITVGSEQTENLIQAKNSPDDVRRISRLEAEIANVNSRVNHFERLLAESPEKAGDLKILNSRLRLVEDKQELLTQLFLGTTGITLTLTLGLFALAFTLIIRVLRG